MTEQRIPQGGLPRPRPRHPKPVPTVATSTVEHIDRQQDGTYRVWQSKENRCCRPTQIGVALICVMGDYGFLQVIKQESQSWY